MPDLPTGTVTFLFTDIEGSTRLLEELGADRYAEALGVHRRALREASRRHGGVEVDTQGDALFVAFPTADGALAAAAAAQAALAGPIRVRMGLHTGEPVATAEGYVGMDVHRGARIAAAGHGGQVLVSETTHAALADGTALRDLGEQRLKDLGAPIRIFQLGDDQFPPLKALYRSTLPVQPSPLVGRERELTEAGELLRGARLVTLTGPGGSGKTRLSLQLAAEAADDFPDGVYWVPLQALRDAHLVLPAVAQAVDVKGDPAEHIGARRLLLVLDNFEQVLEAAAGIADLLQRTPNSKVLCTSRELLRIEAEREYAVDPMPLEDAVRLFEERAAQREPVEAVHEICRRLDCLPLAVELAAARTNVLAPEQLLERLQQALPILTGGRRDAPERQRTLRAAIAWSHDLLEEDERLLFRRLGVFVGSFTLDAAEQVVEADLDTLGALVDKSLLRRWESGRFGMLDTIHEYARGQLEESGEADGMRERHAAFFAELAESAGLAADDVRPQRHDLVLADQNNIRAALDFLVETDALEAAMRLAVALENFWVTQNPPEGIRRIGALLERVDEVPPLLAARTLRVYGSSVQTVGHPDAVDAFERSLAAYRAAGDARGVAIIQHRLAVAAWAQGEREEARRLAEQSLAGHRECGFVKGELQPLGLLGHLEWEDGRPDRALELTQESVRLAHEIGFRWWEAGNLGTLAHYALKLGRFADGDRWAREALSVAWAIGDRMRTYLALARVASAAAAAGQWERAGRIWGATEAEAEREGVPWWSEAEADLVEVAGEPGDGFEESRAAGRALPFERVVDDVLAGVL
jgi:predicted ATPase